MNTMSRGQTRALVVFNPNAGQAVALEQALTEGCNVWRTAGWQVDQQPTQGPGDATRIAREAAAAGYDIVVAAGGDGTVNEVVNGLVGTQTALGALPVGTVNVWVREIGLPLQPRAAAEAQLHATVRRIDLGRAGERHFLLMASLGFDAAVTGSVRSEQKRRLGAFAYVLQGLKVAFRYEGVLARVIVDGHQLRGRYLMAIISNSQLYGGVVKLTASAVIDDGLLDVCLIKGRTLRSAPWRIWSLLTRQHHDDPRIAYFRARRVDFMSSKPMDVQVDGDHIGTSPMCFEIVPASLSALIPNNAPGTLFRQIPVTLKHNA